jgi:polyphosphate kinase 2 (PPK2 family)
MGFCTEEESERFLLVTPAVEREIVVQNGIILRKYFLDISQYEQRRRFEARINDPVKHWTLSPMDIESVRRWWDYTAAYQRMIEATHTPEAPWHIVPADDKRRVWSGGVSPPSLPASPFSRSRTASGALTN